MKTLPIALEKWLPAVWMLVNHKNGISSPGNCIGLWVSRQKSAWFMLHRIRAALKTGGFVVPSPSWVGQSGEVEVDETFVGGLTLSNMHKSRRAELQKAHDEQIGNTSRYPGKTAVQGHAGQRTTPSQEPLWCPT